MCRSYGAQLHYAILLLQRFSSSGAAIKSRIRFRILMPFSMFCTSGATSKPHRGAPFEPTVKAQSLRDEIFVAKEQHNECELRRSATKPMLSTPSKNTFRRSLPYRANKIKKYASEKRCAAPTELNYTMQYYCYKGLAPPELQASLDSVFAY